MEPPYRQRKMTNTPMMKEIITIDAALRKASLAVCRCSYIQIISRRAPSTEAAFFADLSNIEQQDPSSVAY